MSMRALVGFRKDKRKKTWKSLYMCFKDRRQINAFIKRANKLGFQIKVFTNLKY